jgi:hypothetical protein
LFSPIRFSSVEFTGQQEWSDGADAWCQTPEDATAAAAAAVVAAAAKELLLRGDPRFNPSAVYNKEYEMQYAGDGRYKGAVCHLRPGIKYGCPFEGPKKSDHAYSHIYA